tara:strand:+ start:1578 stop:1829 length:252 start_codon:yes stop_codon:yes gene_type:complete
MNAVFSLNLHPKEGPIRLQIKVNKDTGDIEVSVIDDALVYSDEKNIKKSVYTFSSDTDIKTIIETLKWARVKSLTAQGYTVVM